MLFELVYCGEVVFIGSYDECYSRSYNYRQSDFVDWSIHQHWE